MSVESVSYSPNISIRLKIGQKIILLSDVMFNSATLVSQEEVAPGSTGELVLEIDGKAETQQVYLENGISLEDKEVFFSYTDRNLLNGRQLSDFPSQRR